MIKAVITDFDGTLVDTFIANLRAYQQAFCECGLVLTADQYRLCYGLRFDAFMSRMAVFDNKTICKIKELKKYYYPHYFKHLVPNHTLIDIVDTLHHLGVKTAIASTARSENLSNAITALGLQRYFDVIYAGDDVKRGKPDPEIYIMAMHNLGVSPEQTLIFEDSDIGIRAAMASGAKHIRVTHEWFEK